MAKEKQQRLSDEEIEKILSKLEEEGKIKWLNRWKTHMAIPEGLEIISDKKEIQEKILRYLLLRVLINQQAKFEKVREMSIKISEEFTEKILFEPYKISETKLFNIFKEVAGEKGSDLYKVGALGGIKPISLFAYRFKAYEGFIRWLEEKNLTFLEIAEKLLKNEGVKKFYEFLKDQPVLAVGWVGNDPKACRMFVNWIVFLFNEIWGYKIGKMEETLMIVDGHVGKIFCRTGIVEEVLYEKERPYIIQASKMRTKIEKIVNEFQKIPFYVDNGAFYLFEDGFCTDLDPDCTNCSIKSYCKKYTKWTAYQVIKN